MTYNCGFYADETTPPPSDTATNGTSFTPAANTCLPTNGAIFSGWLISGTQTTVSAGAAFTWEYTEDKTFTAQWVCDNDGGYWLNSDGSACEPGYEIELINGSCFQWDTPPVPSKLYTIKTVGAYLDSARTKLMAPQVHNQGGQNPLDEFPTAIFTFIRDTTSNVPINPLTGNPYNVPSVGNFSITAYGNAFYPGAIDASRHITNQGASLAAAYTENKQWSAQWSCRSYYLTEETEIVPTIPGYDGGWYKNSDGSGNKIFSVTCDFSDCDKSSTLYAKWRPITYNIVYELGNAGDWGAGAKHPASVDYDTAFEVSNPISNNGYIFAGWAITGMDSVTHYYSESPIFVNDVYQSSTTQTLSSVSMSGTNATHFMNLRSASGTVTFTAQWECDTANGYHWDTESETCTNVYNITYHNVDSDWISDQPVSYTYGNATQIRTPGKTGYVFLGWCVNDENCANYENNVNYTIPATSNTDIDLYAQWDCDTGYQWNNGECVQTYTLTYSCGDASGGTWDSLESPYPENTTVTLLTNPGTQCDASAMHKIFTRWDCDNATPDANNQFNMPALNVICTARWDCDNANNWWWNADNTACVRGHTITLQQPESCDYSYNPSVPTMLYVIPNIGIYRDSQRNQLMIQQNQNGGQNPIQMPTATCVVKRNFGNLPRNPVTNELYEPISSVTHNNLGTVSMSDIERTISATSFNFQNQEIMSNFCTNNCTYNAIDSNGYITTYGSALSAVDTDMTWTLSMEPVTVTLTELPQITGYDVLWYNNQNGEGNHITGTFCGWCNAPAEIYAIWTPQTRNVLYYKGAHASSTSVDIYQQTNGITYDEPYTALAFDEAPIAEQMSAAIGWKFVGWTTDSTPTFDENGNLNNEFTHVDYYQQSGGLLGGLQLYAAYKCDTENGYHLDTNGACVFNTVNLNWIVNGEPYLQNQSSCIYGNGTINGISHEEIPGWTFTGWTVTNWE